MAIYILFQCCKCNSKRRLHLYSFSINQYDIYVQLCEHFNLKYSYTCKWGFFSLGWKIILEVKVQCRKCCHNYFNFGSNTFHSNFYELNNHHACCYNVFAFSVYGYNYASDGKGLLLQQKQKELEEAFKKEQKMEKQEEIERQEKVKRKQELKKKKEKIILEKIKINKIIETQRKEEKQIEQLYKCDTDYIDSELNNLLENVDFKLNSELSSDISEKMNENTNFKICKFEF